MSTILDLDALAAQAREALELDEKLRSDAGCDVFECMVRVRSLSPSLARAVLALVEQNRRLTADHALVERGRDVEWATAFAFALGPSSGLSAPLEPKAVGGCIAKMRARLESPPEIALDLAESMLIATPFGVRPAFPGEAVTIRNGTPVPRGCHVVNPGEDGDEVSSFGPETEHKP